MDIETFYDQNEARRESPEYEFGSEWTDASGTHYELSWVRETGELYLMVEPDASVTEDAFGDFYVGDEVVTDLTVVIVAVIPTLEGVEEALDGWERAMRQPNSLAWLYDHLPDEDAVDVDDES